MTKPSDHNKLIDLLDKAEKLANEISELLSTLTKA